MQYIYKKSKKRIFISIDALTQQIIFHSPTKLSESSIQKILNQKQSWINKTIAKINLPKPFSLTNNSQVILFDTTYTILYIDIKKFLISDNAIYIPNKYILEPIPHFQKFVKKLALEYMTQRLHQLENCLGFGNNNIKISNAKSYWGQYNSKTKTIRFCWRLIFYNKQVIDYVIIHELCHSIHLNHSQKFWQSVQNFCPEYKTFRSYLKTRNYMHLI